MSCVSEARKYKNLETVHEGDETASALQKI
jgi:hypothetical protein